MNEGSSKNVVPIRPEKATQAQNNEQFVGNSESIATSLKRLRNRLSEVLTQQGPQGERRAEEIQESPSSQVIEEAQTQIKFKIEDFRTKWGGVLGATGLLAFGVGQVTALTSGNFEMLRTEGANNFITNSHDMLIAAGPLDYQQIAGIIAMDAGLAGMIASVIVLATSKLKELAVMKDNKTTSKHIDALTDKLS